MLSAHLLPLFTSDLLSYLRCCRGCTAALRAAASQGSKLLPSVNFSQVEHAVNPSDVYRGRTSAPTWNLLRNSALTRKLYSAVPKLLKFALSYPKPTPKLSSAPEIGFETSNPPAYSENSTEAYATFKLRLSVRINPKTLLGGRNYARRLLTTSARQTPAPTPNPCLSHEHTQYQSRDYPGTPQLYFKLNVRPQDSEKAFFTPEFCLDVEISPKRCSKAEPMHQDILTPQFWFNLFNSGSDHGHLETMLLWFQFNASQTSSRLGHARIIARYQNYRQIFALGESLTDHCATFTRQAHRETQVRCRNYASTLQVHLHLANLAQTTSASFTLGPQLAPIHPSTAEIDASGVAFFKYFGIQSRSYGPMQYLPPRHRNLEYFDLEVLDNLSHANLTSSTPVHRPKIPKLWTFKSSPIPASFKRNFDCF
ncbi:hypothetical protein C8R46DRAFT_1185144 [Mycena filopes]|nr:hypothetical protein C8R46DRAFT_1185140 [Mycena filopes]KAJ7185393.1 hypothetical protein C8R46DRAFT_1288090 [Mycena filopes]KAJ7185396.1 hypothetical protein C8R46DRAFT_1185144 [Mycena filopes]